MKHTIEIFEVDVDGLPDMDNLVGRVAFIWDGNIVNGWPLYKIHLRDPGNNYPEYTKYDWEANNDVGISKVFSEVTKYAVFDKPIWEY